MRTRTRGERTTLMTDLAAANLAVHLYGILTDLADGQEVTPDDVPFLDGATVTTFAEENLPHGNPEVVIHTATGRSFQIPIIQVR
jgi:hypothetical protein